MGIMSALYVDPPEWLMNPIILSPKLYDRAVAEGADLTGLVKEETIQTVAKQSPRAAEQVPVHQMNRHQRRSRMRSLGYSWAQARALARQQEAEASVAAKASRLSPEQARKALAEWAARGGK